MTSIFDRKGNVLVTLKSGKTVLIEGTTLNRVESEIVQYKTCKDETNSFYYNGNGILFDMSSVECIELLEEDKEPEWE